MLYKALGKIKFLLQCLQHDVSLRLKNLKNFKTTGEF